jgi:hypothetical protein
MKLSELNVGTDYAVIPSWTYTSRGARDVATVRENDVVKATLVSKDKYEYEASHRKGSATEFTKAQSGNRSVGVIVKATDSNGNEIFWTSRLADIVAPYAQLEPKWAQAKSEEQKREEEERLRRQKAEQIQAVARAQVQNSRNSIIASCKELLGANCEVNVDTNGYGETTKATVTITLTEFERLIEIAYEGKASVA